MLNKAKEIKKIKIIELIQFIKSQQKKAQSLVGSLSIDKEKGPGDQPLPVSTSIAMKRQSVMVGLKS